MAKSSGADKTSTENLNNRDKESKSKGVLFTLCIVLAIIAIIVLVFGGVFYFIVSKNINGIADKNRSTIQNIPVIRHALPVAADPEDPAFMTEDQIKQKYVEYRDANTVLQEQLVQANEKLNEYQVFKDAYEEMKLDVEKQLQEVKERKSDLDKRELELREQKKEIDKLIANGDKEAFAEYFEDLDPENAALLYEEIMKEQQTDANTKKFAQVYATMDASAAAQIFEQLGNSKIELITTTLKAMSRENSAAILESMTPSFAAKITEQLNALYKGN